MNIKVVSLCAVLLVTFQAQAAYKYLLLGFKPTNKTKVLNFMQGYQNAANKFSKVDHTNFTLALNEGQELGTAMKFFDNELKKCDIAFDPFKDCPNRVIDDLNDDQITAMSNRIEDIYDQIKSDK